MSETATPSAPRGQVLVALRGLCHLVAIVVITVWALLAWPLPWPGLLAAAGFLVLSVLLWALFLSPRPVLHTDRFGRSLVELLFIAGAVAAMLGLGAHWLLAVLFGVVAAVLGYLATVTR